MERKETRYHSLILKLIRSKLPHKTGPWYKTYHQLPGVHNQVVLREAWKRGKIQLGNRTLYFDQGISWDEESPS